MKNTTAKAVKNTKEIAPAPVTLPAELDVFDFRVAISEQSDRIYAVSDQLQLLVDTLRPGDVCEDITLKINSVFALVANLEKWRYELSDAISRLEDL